MKLTLDTHWLIVREAHTKRDEASAKLDEAYAKLDEASAKSDEAYAKWNEARAELNEARVKWNETVRTLCGPDASIEWTATGCIVLGVMKFLYWTDKGENHGK